MPWSQLHGAVRQGDVSAVTSLMAHGVALNESDATGKTPLHQAARCGHVAIATALVRHRADLAAADCHGQTPLHVATCTGHATVVNAFMQSRADANLMSSRGHAPLHSAALAGHLEVAKMLVKHGGNLYLKNTFGQTSFDLVHELGDAGSAAVLQDLHNNCLNNQLVRSGDHLLTKSCFNDEASRMAPLHRAARSGDVIQVGSLIATGASVNSPDKFGQTSMHKLAAPPEASPHAAEMVNLLAKHSADVTASDGSGDTPLHEAATHGHVDMLEALAAKGADVSAKNGRGQTCLHKAAERGHVAISACLIGFRADINAKDELGRTALHRSQWLGNAAVAALLVQGSRGSPATQRESAPALAAELRDPLEKERGIVTAETLREEWSEALVKFLEDHDAEDQKCGSSSMVGLRLSPHEEPDACIGVHEALCRTFQASSVVQLISYFRDSRQVVRAHAAMALGRCAVSERFLIGGEVVSVLEATLRNDTSLEVRKEAATALGIIGAAEPSCEQGLSIRSALLTCFLSDPSAAVEIACNEALLRIFTACPIADLFRMLKDQDSSSRKFAVQALGIAGARNPRRMMWQVLDPLEDVLYNDVSWDVRERVPAALVQCGLADAFKTGLDVVRIIRNFLIEENVNIMLQQLSSNKGEAELGSQVKKACDDALDSLGRHIAFHGWRKIASRSQLFDFPLPITGDS